MKYYTKFVLKINTLCHNNFCHYLVFLRIHNYSKQRKFCWQKISSAHRHYDNTHSIGGHTHISGVGWPNYVLVAPFWVALQTYYVTPFGAARPKRSATPPSQNAVLSGLAHTMAWQKGSVAPTPLARQAYFVAPLLAQAQ